MKRSFAILGLGMFFLSSVGLSADVMWLKLTGTFTYKDLSAACSTAMFPSSLYFGAEVEGAQVVRAVLKDSSSSILSDSIAFQAGELSGIELYQDSAGRSWLSRLPLSARLLGWSFKNLAEPWGSCNLPKPLKTVGPAPYEFVFDTAGLGGSLAFSATQKGTFKGQRVDDWSYVATLQFSQEQWGGAEYSSSRAYPTPPWSRSVSANGSGTSRSSAQLFCQSDARQQTGRLESTCRSHGGKSSSNHAFCSLCNQLGSRWQCRETIQVRCRN